MKRTCLALLLLGVLAGFLQLPLEVTMAFAAGLVVGAFCFAWMMVTS
jgi:hypothetical protein